MTGGFSVDSFWEPLPIIAVFDGAAGPLIDIMQAQFFTTGFAGQAGTFSAVSTTPTTVIPAGKSIRMRSTVSLVADPGATIEMIDLPLELRGHLGGPFLGFVASNDADRLLVPEPSLMALLAVGLSGLATGLRRRRLHVRLRQPDGLRLDQL